MCTVPGPWGDSEGLKRVKMLTPENIVELDKLRISELPRRRSYPRRRRALTLPLGQNAISQEARTHSQSQSLFFKLPGEIRETIYENSLISTVPIHIWTTESRLFSSECKAVGPVTANGWVDHENCLPPDTANHGSLRRHRRSRVLGFLGSCRRM
jgi:hypothetical protein